MNNNMIEPLTALLKTTSQYFRHMGLLIDQRFVRYLCVAMKNCVTKDMAHNLETKFRTEMETLVTVMNAKMETVKNVADFQQQIDIIKKAVIQQRITDLYEYVKARLAVCDAERKQIALLEDSQRNM